METIVNCRWKLVFLTTTASFRQLTKMANFLWLSEEGLFYNIALIFEKSQFCQLQHLVVRACSVNCIFIHICLIFLEKQQAQK